MERQLFLAGREREREKDRARSDDNFRQDFSSLLQSALIERKRERERRKMRRGERKVPKVPRETFFSSGGNDTIGRAFLCVCASRESRARIN